MKSFYANVTLLSCMLMLGNSSIKAQLTDFPYACWQQKGVFQWDFSVGNLVKRNVITYVKDTTVCGVTYNLLLAEMDSWGVVDSSDVFVRNENGKVYISYAPDCADNGLLKYDFNLMPGDTFVKNNGLSDFVDTVVSVSAINLNGEMRKKINFKFATYDVWIDGVGDSTRGLFNQNVGFEGAHYELICQRDSAGIIFVNDKPPYPVDSTGYLHICDSIQAVEPCQLINSVDKLTFSSISIYPTPNDGAFWINIPNDAVNSEITVFDASGREVHRTKAFAATTLIKLPTQTSGVFILQVDNGKTTERQKLIVQ